MKYQIIYAGQRFSRLTTREYDKAKQKWLCECDCGNEKYVTAGHLRDGHTRSCGCLRRETTAASFTKHSQSGTRLYSIFYHMHDRCEKKQCKDYKNYGGRGISVCGEWNRVSGFVAFHEWAMKNGYHDGLSIDRKDANGNYEPDNCRWATDKIQANNQRRNHRILYSGKEYTISQLSELLSIDAGVLWYRITHGWPEDKLSLPPSLSNKIAHGKEIGA